MFFYGQNLLGLLAKPPKNEILNKALSHKDLVFLLDTYWSDQVEKVLDFRDYTTSSRKTHSSENMLYEANGLANNNANATTRP